MILDERAAFRSAAAWFRSNVDRVGEAWDEPGLGEWTIRDLVGHTSRSLVTVETYLDAEPAEVTVGSAAAYYLGVLPFLSGPDVTERGRAAGRAMGQDPAGFLRELDERVQATVADRDDDAFVGTLAGGMRLLDYLPTRTFELVVHTGDLQAALGLALGLDLHDGPAEVAETSALHLAVSLAVALGSSTEVLRGLTGRADLPGGFSLLRPPPRV